MKKIIAYIVTAAAVVALVMAGSVTARATGSNPSSHLSEGSLTARQEDVHQAAELLRELGVDEEDQAIKALSDEWWRCERLKNARYLGVYTVTGYDAYCKHCCARADGITASGAVVTEGYTVAMCRDFPFGTKVYIEGLGIFEVQDRGVGPGKIDVACTSHSECYALTGRYKVWVLSEGESV